MIMQSTAPAQSAKSPRRRSIAAFAMLAALPLLFLFVQPASAQTAGQPLSLFRNYFVTGDYVVGGVGLRGTGVNGFALGTITIPDTLQPKATKVPAGADVLAAYLYWETVESSTTSF